jgi:hypothetical protein
MPKLLRQELDLNLLTGRLIAFAFLSLDASNRV